MFNFLSVWQREELIKTDELERDVTGLIQKDTRKKKFRERSEIIRQYSQFLQDDKISVGRFLVTMANMDSKIVFDEQEYPALDLDEIEFECPDDSNKMREYLKQTVGSNDSDPIIYSSPTKSNENITTGYKKINASKAKSKPNLPPVLTRSKARKLAGKQQLTNKEQQATATSSVNNTDDQITIPALLTRSRAKKNATQQINEDNYVQTDDSTEATTSAKKRYSKNV